MDGYLVHGGMCMPRGSLACIDGGKGMRLEASDGELWITQERDRRDYFVAAGGALVLERDGRTVIYARRASRLTLSAPVPAYYARRITLALAGGAMRVVYERSRERGGWLGGIGQRLARAWTNSYAPRSNPTTAAL